MKDVTNTAKKQQGQEMQVVQVQDDSRYLGSNLPVTKADLNAFGEQRQMLTEFVAKQLRREVDFGVVPGTPKPSLFKPGAEKLNRLFGLGCRYTLTDKMIDIQGNFALFTYKCEIYHLKTGNVIAESEGTCNSQEKKYKERKVWKKEGGRNVQSVEPTPVADILNTLMKMAQKRAYVGATIQATGASDFFTQDLEDHEDGANSQGMNNDSQAELTPEQQRAKRVDGLMANLKMVGVSEGMVRKKYGLDAKAPISTLTDDQCKELNGIGIDIQQKKTTVRDAFPVTNFADGAGGGGK